MNRRTFLKGAGAVSVLAVGGAVYRAYDGGVFRIGQGTAFEAWQNWRSDPISGPLHLVRAGILAASPHNTQPWLFRVHESTIQLFADFNRHLGTMDPYCREMHIGLGCAVENMVIAGQAEGYHCQVALTNGQLTQAGPPHSAKLVATLTLIKGEKLVGTLHQAIPQRHTNRAAYDVNKSITAQKLAQMQPLIQSPEVELVLLTSTAHKQAFTKGTLQATKAIVSDQQMVADSHRWFRFTQGDTDRHRDGLTLEGVGLSSGLLRVAKMLPELSAESSHQIWLDNTREVQLATSVAFGLLLVKNLYNQSANLRVGQVWQRLHLWATTQGLAVQPLNQMMERVDREKQLGRVTATTAYLSDLVNRPGWQATFAFRMGYPLQAALPVVRRTLNEVLLKDASNPHALTLPPNERKTL